MPGIGAVANGHYVMVGMSQGAPDKPKFKQVGGDAIIYFASQWKLNATDCEGAGPRVCLRCPTPCAVAMLQ